MRSESGASSLNDLVTASRYDTPLPSSEQGDSVVEPSQYNSSYLAAVRP
jgi:hypothetical protein